MIIADLRESRLGNNIFFTLHPNDFLSDERLELLSKNSFELREMDKRASKWGKSQFKKSIDEQLLEDMIYFREILTKSIVRNNPDLHLSGQELDEVVQRILDRLMFIRNAEDREIEENRLQSNVREWARKGNGALVNEIYKAYKFYDENYNSKLFSNHLANDVDVDNDTLLKIIEGLNHSADNSYRYDFSVIESDVLGSIYEQYLGNLLKKTQKRAKLEESLTHRKDQGIYYTPSRVVDYIIKNTVGALIKPLNHENAKNIKILDPACGSGSFLIGAYKEMETHLEEQFQKNRSIPKSARSIEQLRLGGDDSDEDFYSLKTSLLQQCIHGVDLDVKAVELAQLSLLLQISERKRKLPLLQQNIRVGNSLIKDLEVSDEAFYWDEQFSTILNNGGFDVVTLIPQDLRG